MNVTSWELIERKLTNVAKEFLKDAYGLELTIPVRVNGRLKRAGGRFIHTWDNKPVVIEVGKTFILYQSWELTVSVLKHECIHYALFMLGKPYSDGHPVFENELKKHGAHSTKTIEYHGKVVQYGCPKCQKVFNLQRRLPKNGFYYCNRCRVKIEYLGTKVV